jgi:hypothetical protein
MRKLNASSLTTLCATLVATLAMSGCGYMRENKKPLAKELEAQSAPKPTNPTVMNLNGKIGTFFADDLADQGEILIQWEVPNDFVAHYEIYACLRSDPQACSAYLRLEASGASFVLKDGFEKGAARAERTTQKPDGDYNLNFSAQGAFRTIIVHDYKYTLESDVFLSIRPYREGGLYGEWVNSRSSQ